MRRARTRPRTGVDVRTALGVVGALLVWFALAFTAPAAVALGTGRPPWPFLAAGAATAVTALILGRLTGGRSPLGVREGFLVVVAVWLLVPAFGALPYVLGRVPQLDHPLDAYFEAMSGFTATGATVLTDVEALGPDMLFWRQLTHWLGGMGIIVLALAVLPRLRIGGRELLRSELPGPVAVESLDATVRGTAQRLWKVYLAVTAAGFLALAALGWAGLDRRMGVFDAFSYATSAVSLGGFTPDADSARGLAPVSQWVLCGLMVVAGVNLLRLYRLVALRQVRAVARDDELRLYLALLVVAAAVLGDGAALRSVLAFAVLYLLVFALGTLGLALDAEPGAPGTGAFTALGAAASCLGNVGPAFGETGPFGSYAPLGGLSKGILVALMFLGRIEIVPLAVLLRRSYWRV